MPEDRKVSPGELPHQVGKGLKNKLSGEHGVAEPKGGTWTTVVKAAQGNFDHLMGVIRNLVRAHNALVEDVKEVQSYVEGDINAIASIDQKVQELEESASGSGAPTYIVIDGEEGQDGEAGPPGLAGATGATGAAGAAGGVGMMGPPGEDGEDGGDQYIVLSGGGGGAGAPGADGATGAAGSPGPPGDDGEDADTPIYILPRALDPVVLTWSSRVNVVLNAISRRIYVPYALTIQRIYFSLPQANTGATTIDVHKNGTTVYTTQGNRPTVSGGIISSKTVPDVTAVAQYDYLEVQIDSVGGATGRLIAYIVCVPAG